MQIQQKTRVQSTWLLGLVLIFSIGCARQLVQQPAETVQFDPQVYAPARGVDNEKEKNKLLSLISQASRDQTYPSALRKRLEALEQGFANGTIDHKVSFQSPSGGLIASSDMVGGRWVIEVNSLQIILTESDYVLAGLPRSDFQFFVSLIYAHEHIHIQRQGICAAAKAPGLSLRKRKQYEEARTWGIEILEIVRPAMKQGRYIWDPMKSRSDTLKKFGDNYCDPRWIASFADYYR